MKLAFLFILLALFVAWHKTECYDHEEVFPLGRYIIYNADTIVFVTSVIVVSTTVILRLK